MAERYEIVEKALLKMLDEKKYSALREVLSTMNPSDIAVVLSNLEEDRIPLLFRLLPKELAAETFVEMDPDAQETLIRGFSDNELKEVVDELYVDDAADLVEEMPANTATKQLIVRIGFRSGEIPVPGQQCHPRPAGQGQGQHGRTEDHRNGFRPQSGFHQPFPPSSLYPCPQTTFRYRGSEGLISIFSRRCRICTATLPSLPMADSRQTPS